MERLQSSLCILTIFSCTGCSMVQKTNVHCWRSRSGAGLTTVMVERYNALPCSINML